MWHSTDIHKRPSKMRSTVVRLKKGLDMNRGFISSARVTPTASFPGRPRLPPMVAFRGEGAQCVQQAGRYRLPSSLPKVRRRQNGKHATSREETAMLWGPVTHRFNGAGDNVPGWTVHVDNVLSNHFSHCFVDTCNGRAERWNSCGRK